MPKYVLKLISLALCVCFILCGCQKGGQKAAEKGGELLWSAYSTVKVLQNKKEKDYYEHLKGEINVSLCKAETEDGQIIISPNKDIKSFELKTADLKDKNGNVFAKENISVFVQKYITVTSNTNINNENFIVGDRVPDMLLPMEKSIEFKENSIKAGTNQGITVSFKADEKTVPSQYSGTFTVVLDGKNYNVPVTVNVWDINLGQKRDFQSSFLIYSHNLLAGEYEASEELIERYQKFFLDYKVDTYVIRNDDSVDKLVKEATTFFDNNNYNSICIPCILSQDYTFTSPQADAIADYVKAIVKISTDQKRYYKYLYLYATAFDEVDVYNENYANFERVFKKDGEWTKTCEKVLSAVREMKEYKAFSPQIRAEIDKSIIELPCVIPVVNFTESWTRDLVCTFCPYISQFDSAAQAAQYQKQAKNNAHGNLWTYTCSGPINPYPTFHIDDYNLGTRVSGWMENKYDVNGYLYWAVDSFECVGVPNWRETDVYNTDVRASTVSGDGYLCYPGRYYGSEYPFASVRLAAFRDSMDDYDMLSLYKEMLAEKCAEYGIKADVNSAVTDLFDHLFTGTIYNTDDAVLFESREILANRILALQSADGVFALNENGKTNIYSASANLKTDRTAAQEKLGKCYRYSVENTENQSVSITASGNGYAAAYFVPFVKTVTVTSVSKNNDSEAAVKGNGFAAVIRSEEKQTSGASQRFKPYVEFAASDLKGVKKICFNMKKSTPEDISGYVFVVSNEGIATECGSFYVYEAESKVVVDVAADEATQNGFANAAGIKFAFDNSDKDGNLLKDKAFEISDVYCEVK
ncbi:MAG: DUF4091 domain-containing protein [Clostridia bacterium]|nr:DUF4091 domain-containing protein [Clostridia bacterium]